MRPRTDREKLVAKLSKKLGSIGKRDERKLLKNTYGSCAYDDMYSRCYAVINQSYQGWQVLRYFRISRRGKRNVTYTTWEVMQLWNKVGEGQVVIARQRTLGIYLDCFIRNSAMEIRRPYLYNGSWVDIPYDYIYNKSVDGIYQVVEDEMARVKPYFTRRNLYRLLSTTQFSEAFARTNPYLCAYATNYECDNMDYITAFKIATRHHYKVEDAASYIDYLNALVFLGKDIHNPFYVCPEDFQAMHDKYIGKMDAIKRKKEREERAKEDAEANEKYQSWRNRFHDMLISDGTIKCHVLQSVSEFFDEGEDMHNCVYRCGYYKKPYSLILSARIDNKRVETVEFDLKQNRVVQAYGKCNKFSEHHEEIVKLVNDNASLIQAYDNGNVKLKIAV